MALEFKPEVSLPRDYVSVNKDGYFITGHFEYQGASFFKILFVAPVKCEVMSVAVVWDVANSAASTMNLYKYEDAANDAHAILSSNVDLTDAARTAQRYDSSYSVVTTTKTKGNYLTSTNKTLSPGERLAMVIATGEDPPTTIQNFNISVYLKPLERGSYK